MADLSSSVALLVEEPADEDPPGRYRLRAVLRWSGKEVPLRWLPLRVQHGAGPRARTDSVTTDSDGIALLTVAPGAAPGGAATGVFVDTARLLSLGEGQTDLPASFRAAFGPLESLRVSIARSVSEAEARAFRPPLPGHPPSTRRPADEPDPLDVGTSVWAWSLPVDDVAGDMLALRVEPSVRQVASRTRRGGNDDVGFLVDVRAAGDGLPRRRPLNLALVLDRSGSMANDGKLDYAKQAVRLVVRNLSPVDRLTLVSYSDDAELLVENGSIHDRLLIEHHLEMIDAMGTTNLSAGLFEAADVIGRGLMEDGINRIVLLSDGLANQGVVNREALARFASQAVRRGITISTVGVGEEFDEDMLLAIATGGQGNSYYVSDPDQLPQVFLQELQELASIVAQNVSLVLELEPGAELVDTYGIEADRQANRVRFMVGSLAAGARALVGFSVRPPPGGPGLQRIGVVRLRYDDVSDEVRRVESSAPLELEYVRPGEAPAGSNSHVQRYLDILAAMDVMLLAEKSGDERSIRETTEFLEAELESLSQWASMADDPEIASLAQVFEHCVMELRHRLEHGGPHHETISRDLRKEIRYKLYRLRRRAGSWSGDSGIDASVAEQSERRRSSPRHFPRRAPGR